MENIVTVLGSINYDLVSYVGKIAEAGETKTSNSFETHFGGKGLNQAIAVSRLLPKNKKDKTLIRMCGAVGNDSFGNSIKEYLVAEDVNTQFVDVCESSNTGVAVIIVEEDLNGENRILVTAGGNGSFLPTSNSYEEIFDKTSYENQTIKQYVILQNETPNAVDSINWIHENRPNITIVYNPSPFIEIPAEVYHKVDILVVNETEAKLCVDNIGYETHPNDSEDTHPNFVKITEILAGCLNPNKASIVVVTLGSRGSICVSKDRSVTRVEPIHIDQYNIKDTTAAGDTFLGALISQFCLNESLGEAMRFASISSSLTIQKKGAAESIPVFIDASVYK